MRKLFIVLVALLLPFSTIQALEVKNNVNVSAGDMLVSFDQSGNEFTVGFGALSFNQSDTVDVGVEVSLSLLYDESTALGSSVTIDGTVTYDYTSDGDSVVGIETPIRFPFIGFVTTPSLTWNINDSDFDGAFKNSFSVMDGTLSSKFMFDIDDFDYTGSDFNLGYSLKFSNRLTINPYVKIPFNDDWDRQETIAGLGFSISLN